MDNARFLVGVGAVAAIGVAALTVLAPERSEPRPPAVPVATGHPQRSAPPAPVEVPLRRNRPAAVAIAPVPAPASAPAPPERSTAVIPAPSPPPAPAPQRPAPPPRRSDPPSLERAIARAALTLVGADPVAEAVWYDAINDPGRSAHERSDLIEDLNEEGFPDPKHVTADDLPLIESRLALIEQLAPDAMDDVNLDAFAEAYKDLVNMYIRASGGP